MLRVPPTVVTRQHRACNRNLTIRSTQHNPCEGLSFNTTLPNVNHPAAINHHNPRKGFTALIKDAFASRWRIDVECSE